ncbi:hypothetical protein COX95_01970 [bacterium CG_4_10_14_0_2_um_filter_33_32]|nr:MAG: hypothetical protein AUJ93_04415 [bacterium CG2_30_33_46]PIR67752.1 MAG: hypothetical protein COU50_01820 [bacterium CG10_big_fil_rev_8_21_14_0_10_33_18]PIU77185.1 MAG: hypothetical protein COS74_00015 [bacterium CG06_land_8_20_14_3_00_33_50]PIW80995.1 MAG: hypothetical protein COZ97_04230 [bacterium CG_4_8_14_3_um_filter_33_28]PIY85266.1 MAG: hypothetical protein COY76_02945 [bacterium CG_4_10_14_0_8_um_filter_33_57]PIZ86207.1 MAG: hypothetical protein COX95_01970 [bacterium CG_4_10_1
MITDQISTINDIATGEATLMLITKFRVFEVKGIIIEKQFNGNKKSIKYFIAKGRFGRISFGSGTVAYRLGEIPLSILISCHDAEQHKTDFLTMIIQKIHQNGAVIEEKIDKFGHELIFDSEKPVAIIETIKMVNKLIKDTDIDMQIFFSPMKPKKSQKEKQLA